MQEIVKNFTLIHVDAPGQEEGAAAYPAGYEPTRLVDPRAGTFRASSEDENKKQFSAAAQSLPKIHPITLSHLEIRIVAQSFLSESLKEIHPPVLHTIAPLSSFMGSERFPCLYFQSILTGDSKKLRRFLFLILYELLRF